MPMPFRMLAALMLLALASAATPTRGAAGLFEIAGGTYRAIAPPNWDGVRKLPLMLYIHGYGQSSASVVDDETLVEAVTGSGALLVAPDGLQHSWSFAGSPSQGELKCWIWSSCAGGHELQMCLHPDGHEIKPEWLKAGIEWARGFRSRP